MVAMHLFYHTAAGGVKLHVAKLHVAMLSMAMLPQLSGRNSL